MEKTCPSESFMCAFIVGLGTHRIVFRPKEAACSITWKEKFPLRVRQRVRGGELWGLLFATSSERVGEPKPIQYAGLICI